MPELTAEVVATGFQRPVFATAPRGDTQRLFIVEQHTGVIRVVRLETGAVELTPFLTVGQLATENEQGLLGLAFHPDYANNGRFFVNFTRQVGFNTADTVVREFTVSDDPDIADSASGQTVLAFAQPLPNHNGGWMGFGPDGFLNISTGDGGKQRDPDDNAQNRGVLLGKLLRLDVNDDDFPNDPTRNYAIPTSNPFANESGVRREIWAFGLRNPWRCSFDRETGDLWIGDVGQNSREEINFQSADSPGGENYGWRLREGSIQTPGPFGGDRPAEAVDPVYDYPRARGFTVIGGYVYRGSIAGLQGHYIFADYGAKIYSFHYEGNPVNDADVTEHTDGFPGLELITSFGEDGSGELYFLQQNIGSVSRIVEAGS